MNFRIETARCILRAWQPDTDRTALARMATDPTMMRYVTDGVPWTDTQVDALFTRQAASLARHSLCVGALCLRDSGEVVGVVGAQPVDRLDGLDLAWWIWREHWGRGLATEAAAAACEDAFTRVGLPRLFACIDPDNTASHRVAQALGMRPLQRMPANQTASWRTPGDVDVYVIERNDWMAQRLR